MKYKCDRCKDKGEVMICGCTGKESINEILIGHMHSYSPCSCKTKPVSDIDDLFAASCQDVEVGQLDKLTEDLSTEQEKSRLESAKVALIVLELDKIISWDCAGGRYSICINKIDKLNDLLKSLDAPAQALLDELNDLKQEVKDCREELENMQEAIDVYVEELKLKDKAFENILDACDGSNVTHDYFDEIATIALKGEK